MKKSVESKLHKINEIKNEDFIKIVNLLKKIKNPILTYNKLMEISESSPQDIGIVFVCLHDVLHPFVFQHLPLYALHHNIILFAVPEGSKKLFETIFEHRYVPIVSILKREMVFEEIKSIICQ
ncbi:hypothetical protein TCON_0603 [Astathelohania contejeani]|uniref:Uncharacterized protein n=1 Tax=Astathelohania contejeani TaxID=164912 RepID=A0ABQ7I1E8_9MICR|nr:hypothetical protein TCON_0603 [Thelohania contejeani]